MSRHSSFSRSSPSGPKAWRSMSKPATPVPSVSIVFAEPEHAQGAALDASAASPPRRRDAASALRKASSFSSLKKGNGDAETSSPATSPLNTPARSPTNTPARSPTPDPAPIPEESSPAPQRSGWFSRARTPDTQPADEPTLSPAPPAPPTTNSSWFSTKPASAPTPIAPPAPAPTPIAPPAPAPAPSASPAPAAPSPPQDIPPPRPASWFARAPTATAASSVDDSVPALAASPSPSPAPVPPAVRPRTRSGLAALNPSASRFTLAMPLLGRPKVPLDRALAESTAAQEQEQPQPQSQSQEQKQPQEQPQEQPPASPSAESGSWWGYVGLGSSSTVVLTQSPPPMSPSESESPSSPSPPSPAAAPDAPPADAAWYTPWRWYAAAPPPPAPPKSEAELVKEAALARPPSPPPPLAPGPAPRASWLPFFATPAPDAPTPDPPRTASPAPSLPSSPTQPTPPNTLLPSFDDTFASPPRTTHASALRRTLRALFADPAPDPAAALPRLWAVVGAPAPTPRRVVVIGIHGWFPGSLIRQVLGEPTGTSRKFARMMAAAVRAHVPADAALTEIALEGEGTIARRVDTLYAELLKNPAWAAAVQSADAILIATHSQGSIVSTQLLDRLLRDGHVRAPQRVAVLAMCGIHLGPLLYLNTSALVQPYLQYFESAAARELFEFQDSESPAAKTYVAALDNALAHGVKFVYVASMNDQVVPIYSGVFATASHPLLLRALYIDGEAHSADDFLAQLLVLLLRQRNAGLPDGGLLAHLSEATAGALSGVGHSAVYDQPAPYTLAVRFLLDTSGALAPAALDVAPFTARAARNDYEIPWALRDVLAHPAAASAAAALRDGFDAWHPRTPALRDLQRKLAPIRRLPPARL